VILFAIATLFMGWSMRNIRVNSDIMSYLPENDPAVKIMNEIGDMFGGNELIMVLVKMDDLFTEKNLNSIKHITDEFRNTEGVSSVTSLTNVMDIREGIDSTIEIAKLIDPENIPINPDSLHKLKQYILEKDRYKGSIVSSDGNSSLIVCQLDPDIDKEKMVHILRKITAESNINGAIHFGGVPALLDELSKVILKDLFKLVPIVSLLIIFTLFFSFRTARGVIVPLLSVLMSTIWTLGTMTLFNVPLTIISDIIPVLLIAIGTAPCIHILSKYDENLACYGAASNYSLLAYKDVGWRIVLASSTTIMGFLSFIFGSYLTMIREFGIFTALGVTYVLLIALIFVPALLTFICPKKKNAAIESDITAEKNTLIAVIMNKLGLIVSSKYRTVIILALLLVIAATMGIPSMKRKVDITDYFRDGSAPKVTESLIEKEFGGSRSVYVRFEGDIQDPAVLREMEKVQNSLQALGTVNNTLSIVDLIKEMNKIMSGTETIPDSREKISNLWFLLEGEELVSRLVNSDKSVAIIQGMVGVMSVEKMGAIVSSVDSLTLLVDNNVCKVAHTGMPLIYKHLDESLIISQIQSLIIAIILILIILTIQLKSVLGGLAGLSPILLSVTVMFGLMGFASIPIDVATVLTGSIALGIGIDYAIHFSVRYKMYHKKDENPAEAVKQTMSTTGKAIIINALAVSMGFFTLFFADLVPLQRFGFLIVIIMIASSVGALTLLPASIMILKERFIRVNVGVK
jgi:hydrophobe/amphiphile efflux-3 (HAE3) family protein